jgi:two-component system chemotaxis sensor kinase CheA
MQDQDVIREFLVESHESLSRLDLEIVELEKHPKQSALLASIFRTFHTIKGTCGFLAFSTLERVTHQAESLLSQLRDGQRELTPEIVSLILETVDATRTMLSCIEASGEEGAECYQGLTSRLRAAVEAATSPGDPGTAAAAGSMDCASVEQPTGSSVADEQAEDRKPDGDCAKTSSVMDANIRVGVGLLDKLMDLVGELVLTRNQILQFNTEREDAALNVTSQRLNLITTELQEGVMKTRMQPIGMVWNKLPRVVRDMAVTLGKQIRLEMDGTETELDRTIIEAIKDPLVHLVRNACDHRI